MQFPLSSLVALRGRAQFPPSERSLPYAGERRGFGVCLSLGYRLADPLGIELRSWKRYAVYIGLAGKVANLSTTRYTRSGPE
jgi:hypothetical protein